MARLEELTQGTAVLGILPDALVTIISTQWYGSNVVDLTYKDPAGKLGNQLVFQNQEPNLEIAAEGRPWSFDGDGRLLRLVSEAYRIRLAYLFDLLPAVHTSFVDPLPHQITAVYEEMLPRQPLCYLLEVDGDAREPHCLRRPFRNEPDFELTSASYKLRDLLARAVAPS